MPIDQNRIRSLIPRLILPGLLATFSAPLTQAAPEVEFISPRVNNNALNAPSTSYAYVYQAQTLYPPAKAGGKKTKPFMPALLASAKRNTAPQEKTMAAKVIDSLSDRLEAQPFAKEISQAATVAGLDPALVHAVIYVESHYRHSAVSSKGAIGLMQVLPDTAARYGVSDPSRSPKLNLKAGTLYLRDLLRMFDNRADLALAAYNAGEGTVLRYKKVPPYPETQQYVRAVLAKYNEWRNVPAQQDLNNSTDTEVATEETKPAYTEYMQGTRLAVSDSNYTLHY